MENRFEAIKCERENKSVLVSALNLIAAIFGVVPCMVCNYFCSYGFPEATRKFQRLNVCFQQQISETCCSPGQSAD